EGGRWVPGLGFPAASVTEPASVEVGHPGTGGCSGCVFAGDARRGQPAGRKSHAEPGDYRGLGRVVARGTRVRASPEEPAIARPSLNLDLHDDIVGVGARRRGGLVGIDDPAKVEALPVAAIVDARVD